MRRIQISWHPLGISVDFVLDEGRNAAQADALWESLPYRSLQGHALVAGEHLYHVAPVHEFLHIDPRYTLDRRLAPDGTLFSSKLQHVGIKYGPLTEPMAASPIGRVVPEHEARLKAAGRAVWDAVYAGSPNVMVEVRRSPGEGGHRIRRLPASSPTVDALVREICDETERVWLDPPGELLRLHAGDIDSGAGTFGTVLTTLVFVNGETRPLGYASYGALVRAAATTDLPVESLRQMARLLVATPAEFLGYCGLRRLWSLTQRVVAALDKVDSRTDFLALAAHMALYVNCLNGWNLQLFPWRLGGQMRQARSQGVGAVGAVGAAPQSPWQLGGQMQQAGA